VKKLKDRVIHLEQELQDTQRTAGLPVILPYDTTSLKLTPQMSRKQPPPTTFYQKLETEFSDTEISDLSPDAEDGKTATVERKVPVKDEFDTAVPQTQLLDSSVIKSKSGLARGGLAKRQLPKGKKSHSNSGSDGGLDGSEEEEEEEDALTDSTSITHSDQAGTYYTNGHYSTPNISAIQQRINSLQQQTTAAAPPLYAQVHKDRTDGQPHHITSHSTIPNIYR
jgi:neurabin